MLLTSAVAVVLVGICVVMALAGGSSAASAIKVPKLVGQTPTDALLVRIQDAGFYGWGEWLHLPTTDKARAGRVARQDPQPGAEAAPNSFINIWTWDYKAPVASAPAVSAHAGEIFPDGKKVPALTKEKAAPGEIVIRGKGGGRVYGPFRFAPGEYLFRFARWHWPFPYTLLYVIVSDVRPGTVGGLESDVVDTLEPSGENRVEISGWRYVYVYIGEGEYILRFSRTGPPSGG